jgi:hypothetical protein
MNQRQPNLYDDPEEVLTPHYDTGVVILLCISNTLLPFLRKNLGYRLLQPRWLTIGFLVMLGAGYLEFNAQTATLTMHQDGLLMMGLAVMMMMGAGAQRWKARPQAQTAATHIHTRSRGNSTLMPLFRIFRIPEVAVQSWLEPIFAFALGCYLVNVGWELTGWWLAIAAVCLSAVEGIVTKNQRVALMNLRDNRVDAQTLQSMDSAAPGSTGATPPPRTTTAELSPELMRLHRKKRGWFG